VKKIFYLSLLMVSVSLQAKTFKIDPKIFDSSEIDFKANSGDGPFDSYLVQTLDYGPLKPVFAQLQGTLSRILKNRGEGHITVVSPVEYFKTLKPYLSMKEINEMALDSHLQSTPFRVVCLGRGRVEKMETYFLVVQSPKLEKLRENIQQKFIQNGGDPKQFDPHLFYPHITLGFTDQDLFIEQGVIKDQHSCIARVKILQ
jgi:2'-5' RNA ligase